MLLGGPGHSPQSPSSTQFPLQQVATDWTLTFGHALDSVQHECDGNEQGNDLFC